MGTVLANGDCQLYCIWNQFLWGISYSESLKQEPLHIWATLSGGCLLESIWKKETAVCLLALALVVSPSVSCYNAPSPILEPTSLGFQCRLKTGSFSESSKLSASGCNCRDIQPRRLNNDHIPPLSTVSQQLLYYLEYML